MDNLSFFVLDTEGEYRDLLSGHIKPDDLWCFDYSEFKYNLYAPQEGVSFEQNLRGVSRGIAEVTYTGDTGTNIHNAVVKKRYESTCIPPTLDQVKRDLENLYPTPKGGVFVSWQGLINRYGWLNDSLGVVHNTDKVLDIGEFENKVVVINLSGLDSPAKIFFANNIQQRIVDYKERNPEGTIISVIDELHRFVSIVKKNRESIFEPIILENARTRRKRNYIIWSSDQSPHQIPRAIIGNAATKFSFRLTERLDKAVMGSAMGLDHAQEEELGNLSNQRCVVASSIYGGVHLIRVRDLDLAKGNRAELESRMMEVKRKIWGEEGPSKVQEPQPKVEEEARYRQPPKKMLWQFFLNEWFEAAKHEERLLSVKEIFERLREKNIIVGGENRNSEE